MNRSPFPSFCRRLSDTLTPSAAWLLLLAPCTVLSTGRAAEGALEGTVSNTATRNLLEGAKVEIPQLTLAAFTDNTGRYVLTSVPAGTHELVVSYLGLDAVRRPVTIVAGQRANQNFDLTTAIYQLDQFKVVGEREGDASAITAQRNAPNLKNVAATDSFGNLPNMNAGEVALRFPGVYGEIDAGGNASGFNIRGMGPGLNTITMDGAMLTGQGGMNRSIFVNNITGAMFEQVELVKGHTPDKGADSLGGTINFKSRSPLGMREKRRLNYNLSARIAPSFTQQIPIREERRTHGLANLSYQEVFGAFGGDRNLGVVLNLFNSETALGWFTSQRDFQNTSSQPAFVWDYRTGDVYNHRRQKNVNTKVDYRLSPNTKLSFRAAYIDHSEVYRRQYNTRAYTGTQNQNTVPNATTSIMPGFTDRITTVRPVPTSTLDITMIGPNNFFNRLRRADVGAEHDWVRGTSTIMRATPKRTSTLATAKAECWSTASRAPAGFSTARSRISIRNLSRMGARISPIRRITVRRPTASRTATTSRRTWWGAPVFWAVCAWRKPKTRPRAGCARGVSARRRIRPPIPSVPRSATTPTTRARSAATTRSRFPASILPTM